MKRIQSTHNPCNQHGLGREEQQIAALSLSALKLEWDHREDSRVARPATYALAARWYFDAARLPARIETGYLELAI